MRISLCLLVRNELRGCEVDVPRLPHGAFDEVYAVDGHSTDGTVEYLQDAGIPVYLQPKKGLNAAYVHANQVSSCDAVVVFFPKGTIDPESLRDFRPLLESGAHLVVASRSIPGARNEEDAYLLKPRKWGVAGLSWVVSLLWRREGYRVRDVLHGVKGFSRAAFAQMDILDHGVSIDLEMVARSYKLRLVRAELPVSEGPRAYGQTHFPVLPTALKLLQYLWWELRRRD